MNYLSAPVDLSYMVGGNNGTGPLIPKEGPLQAAMVGTAFFISILSLPIRMGLTTARLAILLLFFLSLIKLFSNDFKLPSRTLLPLFAAIFPFAAYAVSLFINGGKIWPVFAWWPLGFLGTCVAICVSDLNSYTSKYFVGALLFSQIIAWGLICVGLHKAGILFTSGPVVKNWFDQNVYCGLNRFMNSMVVFSCIDLVALLSNVFKKRISRMMTYVPIFLTIYFSLNSGSRQSLLAIFVFSLFVLFNGIRKNRISLRVFHSFLRILVLACVIVLGLFIAIRQDWLDSMWIEQRFVNTLITREKSVRGDETRIYLVKNAIGLSREKNGFGIGPGRFSDLVDLYPHNGYAGFLAEAGLLPGGAALFFVLLTVLYSWRRRKSDQSSFGEYLWIVFFLIGLFMVFFNDLFREPIFWAPFGLAVGFSARERKTRKPSIRKQLI